MNASLKFSAVVILLGVALLSIAGAGVHLRFKKTDPKTHATQYVMATTVQEKVWQTPINSTGLLHAREGTTLTAEAAGRVTAIHFESGDSVKAGQLLLELDNATQRGNLVQAKANLISSQQKYNRVKTLYKTATTSPADYDQTYADYQSALGKVQVAQAELDKTLIKAPFDGVLGLKTISIGNYLTPGTEIVNLQNLDSLYLDFNVPEKYLDRIRVGQPVDLLLAVGSDAPIHVNTTLLALDIVVHSDMGSITVRSAIPNVNHEFRPGEFATVTLRLGNSEKVLTVPQTALLYSSTGNFIYRIVDHKLVKTAVNTGKQIGQAIVVTGPIHAGDLLVKESSSQLQDQMSVQMASPPG